MKWQINFVSKFDEECVHGSSHSYKMKAFGKRVQENSESKKGAAGSTHFYCSPAISSELRVSSSAKKQLVSFFLSFYTTTQTHNVDNPLSW